MSKYLKYIIILFFLAVIVYFNSLHSPFMLDDYGFFNQFQGQGILSYFIPDPHRAYYRPLAHIVPHLNYLVFKTNPLGYHMVNVLLLVLAAWSVVLLLSMVMVRRLALAVGILFLVHPINGIMVNYITASVFAVQIICMCMALYFTILSFPNVLIGNPISRMDSRVRGNDIFGSFFFVLALLCHETSFMIPFYGVLLCLMREMNFKKALNQTKWLWLSLALYMLFRAFNAPLSKSLFHSIAINGLSVGESLASVLQLLSWYIQKLFYPVGIFLMWSKPFVRQHSFDWLTIGLIICVGLGIVLRYLWRGERQVVLFVLWFLVGLLPVFLGAFATPFMGALLEPHWFIPATIGFFAAAVVLLAHLVRQRLWQNIIFGAVLGILVICAWGNNKLWSNEVKLYEQWSLEDPEFKAIHYFLGTVYKRQGNGEQAREHFLKSIVGRSKDWIVYLNLSQLDISRGNLLEAEKNAQMALNLEPRHTDIFNTLGAIEYAKRNWDDSTYWFEKSINANRFNLEPRMNLALVYLNVQDVSKAVGVYGDILKIAPDFKAAQEALANLRK